MNTHFLRRLLFLIILSLPGLASAFYNPTAGRFISRDPLGDGAFFRQYVQTRPFDYQKLKKESLLPPYLFVANNSVNSVDATGLDRYITNFSPLLPHVGVAVDTYKKKDGKWVKDGIKTFDFMVDWQFGGPGDEWGFDYGNILLGMISARGRISESDGLNLAGDPITIKSNPCQDMKMLLMIQKDMAGPMRYNVFFQNCIVWASKAIAYGLKDPKTENCCNPNGTSANVPGQGRTQ